MVKFLYILLLLLPFREYGQAMLTPFEKSNGTQTATYSECIAFYKQLAQTSPELSIKETGSSDAGYPYHLILYSNDRHFDPSVWHRQHKIVILINNGIHPGEPDGVDASMLLLRDLVSKKISLPENIALALIPLYNIGGALNRGSFSRVNQNGPQAYGFRGNAQNLDLNRDFTKCDSRNARSFTEIFHWVNPDIQIDNHVSDGADYQHTMTLLSTQWNKLGGDLGKFLHGIFQPALFASMEEKGWPICPYVNFEEGSPEKGWKAFYDQPRYSSGYAALFNTIAFIPETHMLKPFRERVLATYSLLQSMIEQASAHAQEIISARKQNFAADLLRTEFPLHWKPDTTQSDLIRFRGYTAAYKPSEVTGRQRLYYDHTRPFEKDVVFYDYFAPNTFVTAPEAYVIPGGWHEVIDLLRLNGVQLRRLAADSQLNVQVYHITDYSAAPGAYEKHHRNSETKLVVENQIINFRKGDCIITTHQPARRFLIEMLEPAGEDSYFTWNFFDAVLQQKEGYSDYRWEDQAAAWLKDRPALRAELEEKKRADTLFAQDAPAQLDFVYKHSPWYEPEHLRYPVYRIVAGSGQENTRPQVTN